MKYRGANSIFSFIIMTAGISLLLTACGSSKSGGGSGEFSSGTDDGLGGATGKPIAYCNKASNSSLSYKIMAQYTGSGTDPNWAHLKIHGLPAGFESGTVHLQFWKAYASNDSSLTYHGSPITFSVWDLNSGTYIKENLTSLSWSGISSLTGGASLPSFLSRVLFVLSLQDPNGQFTVFSASTYSSADNSIQSNLSALLPAFYADPADYAVRNDGLARESVLRNMHPLRNQSGDFSALATALCQ